MPPTPSKTRAAELLHALAGAGRRLFRQHQLEAVRDLVEDRAPRAVRAAHRLGQVGGLLPRHGAAARARRRPGADRLAAAGADAQPDRRGRAARDPRAHGQLDEPRRVGRGARAARRRRGRPPADQPRAAQQPAVPRRDAAAVRRARRAARGRRGALHLRLGPRLPPRLPARSPTMLERLPDGVAVLGTTATANDRVVADVEEQLRARAPARRRCAPTAARSGRSSLRLEVVELPGAGRPARLARHVAAAAARARASSTRSPSATPSSSPTGSTAPRDRGGGLQRRGRDRAARRRSRSGCCANDVKAVVATSALGHGLRQARPRLRRPLPGARLGRSPTTSRSGARAAASTHADVVLLRGAEDRRIQDFFIEQAFPRRELVDRVLERLDGAGEDGLSLPALIGVVNLGRGRIEAMLKVLDVEGAVTRARQPLGAPRPGAAWHLRRRALRARSPRCAAPSRRRWRPSAPTAAA